MPYGDSKIRLHAASAQVLAIGASTSGVLGFRKCVVGCVTPHEENRHGTKRAGEEIFAKHHCMQRLRHCRTFGPGCCGTGIIIVRGQQNKTTSAKVTYNHCSSDSNSDGMLRVTC